jgi:hypothetical protein
MLLTNGHLLALNHWGLSVYKLGAWAWRSPTDPCHECEEQMPAEPGKLLDAAGIHLSSGYRKTVAIAPRARIASLLPNVRPLRFVLGTLGTLRCDEVRLV